MPEALNESINYEAVLDAIPIAIAVHRKGRVVYTNAAARQMADELGFSKSQDGHLDILGHLSTDARNEIIRFTESLRLRGDVSNEVLRLIPKPDEGRAIPFLVSSRPITWEGEAAMEICVSVAGSLRGSMGELVNGAESVGVDFRHESFKSLTERERQIAVLIAKGKGTEEVAGELGVAVSTVRTHLKSVYRKTATHSRVELVRFLHGVF